MATAAAAIPNASQLASLPASEPIKATAGGPGVSLDAELADMAAAVQRGDFAGAEAVGAAAPLNLAVPRASLRLGRAISEGAQAGVLEAELMQPDGSSLKVAVKKPRIREAADLERFRQEVALLAALRHPHIVELLAARMLPPEYLAVLRLEATSAAAALHECGWRPGFAAAAALGAQLAAAVAHMHTAGYVHRDVKPANLLLSADLLHARLADLGLASPAALLAAEARSSAGAKPTGGFHKQRMVGTLEYMAPEVLQRESHSTASDVFSLAVTLNELATGVVPYSDCTRDNPLAHTVLEMGYGRQELAAAVAADSLRPTMHAQTPPALRALLLACWERQPELRPSAAAVEAQMQHLAAELAATQAALPPPAPPTPDLLPSLGAAVQEEGKAAVQQRHASVHHVHVTADWAAEQQQQPAWLQPGGEAVAAGAFATPGARGADRMEDAHLVAADAVGPGSALLGVFDGHRGAEAALYLQGHLGSHLQQRLAGSSSGAAALAAALFDADASFRWQQAEAHAQRVARLPAAAVGAPPVAGSTATVALVHTSPGGGQRLALANLGDSRAVLCRGGRALQLLADQTAERADERQRVEAAGGRCSVRAGGWRVGDAGLAVTRSVGDADFKAQGVTAEAETAEVALTPQDTFLVLATDGLWDRLSNEEVVALVHDTVKQPTMCAQRLVTEALARGSGDNVTCVVAFLDGAASTAERVYHRGTLKYH